jgi:hypothetical protein
MGKEAKECPSHLDCDNMPAFSLYTLLPYSWPISATRVGLDIGGVFVVG